MLDTAEGPEMEALSQPEALKSMPTLQSAATLASLVSNEDAGQQVLPAAQPKPSLVTPVSDLPAANRHRASVRNPGSFCIRLLVAFIR
jgi:hypothetical protein